MSAFVVDVMDPFAVFVARLEVECWAEALREECGRLHNEIAALEARASALRRVPSDP